SIDVLKLVPSHYETLLAIPNPADIVPHDILIITGEPTYWETVAKVRAHNPRLMVQDHYGVTETTCATLVYAAPLTLPTDVSAAIPKGSPLGNTAVYILDEAMQPVPLNIPGELYIGGAGVTRGYMNRPTLTAERFLPDPFTAVP